MKRRKTSVKSSGLFISVLTRDVLDHVSFSKYVT